MIGWSSRSTTVRRLGRRIQLRGLEMYGVMNAVQTGALLVD